MPREGLRHIKGLNYLVNAHSCSIRVSRKDGSYILTQVVKVVGDDVPDNLVVDGVVAMDEDVLERDDLSVLTDKLKNVGIVPADPIEGFTHDLELPLDGATELLVRGVRLEGACGSIMP